jgi:hypothetical protein
MEDAADMNVHKLNMKRQKFKSFEILFDAADGEKARKTSSRGCLHLNRAVSAALHFST